jgi:hypothetical protein
MMPASIPEDLLMAWVRRRGLAFDPERAAELRPLVEGLLGRLARFAESLPRDAAPTPCVPPEHETREPAPSSDAPPGPRA